MQLMNQLIVCVPKYTFKNCFIQQLTLLPEDEQTNNEPSKKRRHVLNRQMCDFVVLEKCGQRDCETNVDHSLQLLCYETIDSVIGELHRRFLDNSALLQSIATLEELDIHKLDP